MEKLNSTDLFEPILEENDSLSRVHPFKVQIILLVAPSGPLRVMLISFLTESLIIVDKLVAVTSFKIAETERVALTGKSTALAYANFVPSLWRGVLERGMANEAL